MAKPDGSSELSDPEKSCSLSLSASPMNMKSIDDVEKSLRNISSFVIENMVSQSPSFQSYNSRNLVTCLHIF